MLERVDRIQLAVTDAAEVARAFQEILGAEPAREDASDYLNARRTVLALGVSEIYLFAPLGAGIVRAHLDRWGPGLLTAGFSVASVAALRAHLIAEGVEFTKDGEQTYLEPTETAGMRVVVSPETGWRRLGLVSHLYEVTDHQRALRLHRHTDPVRSARPPGPHRDLPGDPPGHRDGPVGGPSRGLALHVLRRDRGRGRHRAAPDPARRALHPARRRRAVDPPERARRSAARHLADHRGLASGPAVPSGWSTSSHDVRWRTAS